MTLMNARQPDVSSLADDRAAVAQVAALDELQTGHIRHIHNIAHQPMGEWAHMGTRLPFQENFESLRYQLAYMAFALGLAHFHRLPAAPGYFRPAFDRLVQKMLHPDVWYFWRDTSRGGGAANLDAPRSDGWIDPVYKDNIMFSAYVQSMSVMYNFLFDDPKYAEPGALTFRFNPILFRLDTRQDYVYDQNSLNDHIYWRMVESGYLGVACEPYCVFQICNQPAILAFRLHDILNGTDRAAEVTEGYLQAWGRFGFLDEHGRYNPMVKTNLGQVLPNVFGPWADGWLGALLHMWNPQMVREHYPQGIRQWLVEFDDGTAYVPPSLAEDLSAGSALDFGFCCMWAAEVGDTELLGRFLKYADTHLSPRWEHGGYFYPRNDTFKDETGRIVMVSPCAGNALLPYARLNVPSGLWGMYNEPWGREHFCEPLLTEVSDNLDLWRARYLPDCRKLVFTVSSRADRTGAGELLIANVWRDDRASWTLSRDGVEVARGDGNGVGNSAGVAARRSGDALALTLPRGDRADLVLSWS